MQFYSLFWLPETKESKNKTVVKKNKIIENFEDMIMLYIKCIYIVH